MLDQEGIRELVPIIIICKDCNHTCDSAYSLDWFNPNMKYECVECQSSNTETRPKQLNS